MLQVDCLLTFAIGTSLATAAGDSLKVTQYHTRNQYFIYMLLHISLLVAPLNVYMLWEHTGFETMFYYDASMHGIWPALNVSAFTLCAILGFMVGRKLVRQNKELTAYTVWTTAYTILLAIVSVHYDRFLYPGGIRDFYEGKAYGVKEFLQSELCQTLTVSLILMASPVFYAQIFWPRSEGLMTKVRKGTIKWHCAKSFTQQGAVAAAIFVLLKLANVVPVEWGWERLLAIALGQLAGSILILPVFLISTRYTVTKRIDIRRAKQTASRTNKRRQPRSTSNLDNYLDDEEIEDDYEQEAGVSPGLNGTNGHVSVAKQE